jgi:hypothetical protein
MTRMERMANLAHVKTAPMMNTTVMVPPNGR